MSKFTPIQSRLVPIPADNIDTDQIIPARFLKTTTKEGLDRQLFCDWRYEADGVTEKPGFILNTPRGKGASVLLAGDNFGCGSSREHAPWALAQYGFRAVISTSFADIFKNNSTKNGLLPVTVDRVTHAKLFALDEAAEVKIDLASETLTLPDGEKVKFAIDPFAKNCMLEGVDELGYIQKSEAAIAAFEMGRVGTLNTLAGA